MQDDYQLADSGEGRKLEKFGPFMLDRPCSQAVWKKYQPKAWKTASASFTRKEGMRWEGAKLPDDWTITVEGLRFKLSSTDFGHLGIFPEQRDQWRWIRETIKSSSRQLNILNLFAYSGGSTLAAAVEGARVCHLDASKGMVAWARENAELNGLKEAPIRWIVDDVTKFLKREVKRGSRYDGIFLDPPSFGRGKTGEVYKIDEEINTTLDLCRQVLSSQPALFLLSCHTPGYTPTVLTNLVEQTLNGKTGTIACGEMLLEGPGANPLPSGAYARWQAS